MNFYIVKIPLQSCQTLFRALPFHYQLHFNFTVDLEEKKLIKLTYFKSFHPSILLPQIPSFLVPLFLSNLTGE